LCDLIEMTYNMTESQNRIYRREFKRYFLEDLYFYWNLSEGNKIINKLEKSFGLTLARYSAVVSKKEMNVDLMRKIVETYRTELNIMIKANISVDVDGQLKVEFEQYLLGVE